MIVSTSNPPGKGIGSILVVKNKEVTCRIISPPTPLAFVVDYVSEADITEREVFAAAFEYFNVKVLSVTSYLSTKIVDSQSLWLHPRLEKNLANNHRRRLVMPVLVANQLTNDMMSRIIRHQPSASIKGVKRTFESRC